MLPRGEYATAYHGKWHLGDEIYPQHGFDEWLSTESYAKHYSPGRDQNEIPTYDRWLLAQGFRPQNGHRFGRGEAARLSEEYGKPAYLARTASRFIRENKDRPFCLYVNFLEPHMPFYGPRDDQYDPSEVTLPENFDNPPDATNHMRTRVIQRAYQENGYEGDLRTEDDWRRLTARYWGLCSLVDTHVGSILRTLEESGAADNTIVVYTSDHGDMMGSHRILAKTVQYEEAVRVPLLVRLPGQRQGRRIGGAIGQVDLVPMLIDVMGAPVPSHLEGRSRADMLSSGGPDRVTDDVIIEWNNRSYDDGIPAREEKYAWWSDYGTPDEIAAAMRDTIRTILTPDGWKFNWSRIGQHELFDLNTDPYEIHNRARDETERGRMRAMADRVRRWQERTRDIVEMPEI